MKLLTLTFYSKLLILDREYPFFGIEPTSLTLSRLKYLDVDQFFRSQMLTGSKRSLEFQNILFGNELNAWDRSAFTAPVHGIYSFKLQMSINPANRAYSLRASINGETGIEKLQENASYYRSSGYGNTYTFEIDRELRQGDVLKFIDQTTYNSQYENTDVKCRTNNVDHTCTYVTGRLIKKL